MLCKLFIYNIEDIRFSSYWRKRRYSFLFVHEHWNVKTDSSRCARIVLWSLTLRALNILFIKSFCTLCTFWMPWATIWFCITVRDRQKKREFTFLKMAQLIETISLYHKRLFKHFRCQNQSCWALWIDSFCIDGFLSSPSFKIEFVEKPLHCSKLDKKHLN